MTGFADLPAEYRAEWDSFIRDTLTPRDLIILHRRIPGAAGLCFGCLECGRRVVWPCQIRASAERRQQESRRE
ncbi:hypothetical protein [Longispora albida]|uniref:hypothetical protein n=1 Tax=Longispora albida TaxID=203523 RepID=UPI00036999EB|nr:hypothetical protein [Longispora albida]